MIASQLLYTSWKNGNSTTKGYMVYAKSKDITEIEETEICAIMKYKAPDNLPYTPSDEEIEILFPKMFAYFKLSSGRFCIAQSSYIGQDYTNRWGNYIIHAYVLDDIGDLVPSKMIGTNIFRTRLTEEELNADSAPESLPKVEIENNGNALTEQEVKIFFENTNRRNVLKGLAQSVYDAVLNNKRIQLFDELSNMRTWIIALSMIVPKNILNRMYFNTYSTDSSELITVACKSNSAASNAYAQSYLPNDLISIDVERYEGGASIGCYFDAVCNRLFDGYYDGILCSNNVNKSMIDYHCDDCNLAYKLTYVQKGELDYISSNDELLSIVAMLTKHEERDMSEVFNKIFIEYSSSELYIGDASSIAVFKLLYPHLLSESKADLLMMYVDKKFESNKDACAIYLDIKADCPCSWDEAVMCFLRQTFREHFGQHLSNAAALLMCNSWITVYPRCNDEQQQRTFEQICALYARQIISRDMQAVSCILDCCMSVDENLYNSVYKSVCKTSLDKIGKDEKYLFEYLNLSIDKGGLFWGVLISAINKFPALERRYIQQFVALRDAFELKVSNLTRYAERYPEIRKFVDNVDVYAFENTQITSFDDLIISYNKYIGDSRGSDDAKNKCKVVFAGKVRLLLKQCDEKESIKYAITLYDELYRGNKELSDEDKNVLNLISETIYNDDRKNIALINKCLAKTPFETTVALMSSCQHAGVAIHPRALLIYEGHYFEKALEKENKSAQQMLQRLYDENRYMFLSKSCSGKLLEEFLSCYMDAMINGMYMLYRENDNLTASDLIDYFLAPISKSYIHFCEDMLKVWRSDILITNENMDMYFLYMFEKNNAFRNELRDTIEEYLVRIGKGKRNALFEELEAYFADNADIFYSQKLDKYIKDFNKNHVSFGDKIKNIFSAKDEEEHNGRKK